MSCIAARVVQTMVEQLTRLSRVIGELDEVSYANDPGTGLSGPVGAHVRHTLDHVVALLDGLPGGVVDYDSRVRGTLVERRQDEALAEVRRLSGRLASLDAEALTRPVRVSVVVEPVGTRAEVASTAERELLFVANHMTHHEAIMAMLMHARGRRAPVRFGFAPATPAPSPCAPSA
jgi:hypothetical protein